MQVNPKIEQRAEQPYVAISARVKMEEIPTALPPFIPAVYTWLQNKGLSPAGPVFFHYGKMELGKVEVEVGVPVSSTQTGDGHVQAGSFPAGRYAVTTFMGHYTGLPQVHAALELWRAAQGERFLGPRTEFYPTDPAQEPNPDKWQTDVVIPLATPVSKAALNIP